MDFHSTALSIVGSLLPSLLLLAYIHSQDRRKKEQLRYLALTFAAGMFSAVVAFFLFELLEMMTVYRTIFLGSGEDDLAKAAFAMGVVGPAEECLKLAAVVLTASRLGALDEPADGIIYSTAAALGFASSENWYAMWATGGLDLGRAAVVPFVHMLFSAFSGWGLGESLAGGRKRRQWPVYLGLALASTYHGLYNYVEFIGGMWHFVTLPIVAIMWVFLTRTLGGFVRLPLQGKAPRKE
ncbi:MAG: PrsW family intramembrane metalloprotease [Deltaproteobacteria bacterium]|nr:PrsW family intramembrane metalloprotease [Deltaproteobacteria bacterium]